MSLRFAGRANRAGEADVGAPSASYGRAALRAPAGLAVALAAAVWSGGVCARNLLADGWDATALINIAQGAKLSRTAERLGLGGFELSDGTFLSFDRWYKPQWTDMRFDLMTQLNENFGLLWSVSTGEYAPKYRISPELRIGFIAQAEPIRGHFLALSYTYSLGGRLSERACVADYGDIVGQTQVHCRLAASTLAPEETLRYLANISPRGRNAFGLKYRFAF